MSDEITYRVAGVDDAALASDVMTASYPALAQDPVLTRLRWKHPRRDFAYGRYIAERSAKPIAFLAWVHGPWDQVEDRHCEVETWIDRSEIDRELVRRMVGWVSERAVAEGSRILLAYCGEDEPVMLEGLGDLGFKRERVERVWELDLVEHGARLADEAAEARRRMAAVGIRYTVLSDWHDPDRTRKLHELNERTVHDIPHTLTIVPEALEDFERRLEAPDRPHDRYWIALDGDLPVALSYLKFPPVRGPVWTGYTCTHPGYRGRGLARAIKLQTLAQAIELRVPLVYTSNDSENVPILHINEALGYRPRPGFVEHHKRVTNTGHG